MTVIMKIDDKTRLKILQALNKKNAVKANLKQLKKETNFHIATIKGSIDFLTKKQVLIGFGPKIDFRKFNLKLEATTLLQADLSKKDSFNEFVNLVKKDPHTYWLSNVLSSGNFNLIQKQLFSDVEEYQKNLQKHYIEKMKDYFGFIKDKQVFFTTEPAYKAESRTETLIKIILGE